MSISYFLTVGSKIVFFILVIFILTGRCKYLKSDRNFIDNKKI